MTDKNVIMSCMTPTEMRIYRRNSKKSPADLIKDSKMMANTLKEIMGIEVEQTLEDGEVVNVPIANILVAKKIAFDIEHPEKIDLKEYATVLGENKVEQEITVRGADALFGDLVIKENN